MYHYQDQRPKLLTDDGQRKFLQFRDRANELVAQAGAFRLQEAMAGIGGDNWLVMACADRMVELGELREVTGSNVAGQHRVFTK